MNEMITTSALPVPSPRVPVTIRPGTLEDVPFMDALQRRHERQVGWMPTKQFEGKIALGHVLVAEQVGERVGYVIGNDRYFKRDEVGVIYQLNVEDGKRRGYIGAALLRALFERAAYGCRLFCCWCAQDIEANHFWEAMGFVPLAFRTGSRTKGAKGTPRVHIFWQKRIVEGDTFTPYWYPHQTSSGAVREDRLVLPIPPGTHWSEAKPILLPQEGLGERGEGQEKRALPGPREKRVRPPVVSSCAISLGGMRVSEPAKPKLKVVRRAVRNNPEYVAAARELRDRYLERVNTSGLALGSGKYQVGRLTTQAAPAGRMLAA